MSQIGIKSFYAGPASDNEVEIIIGRGGSIVYPAFQSPFSLLYSRNMQD